MCCSSPPQAQQQGPTPQEHALAETGAKEFNRFADAFLPATADYIDATSSKESDRLSLASGIAGEVAKTTAGRGTDAALIGGGLRSGLSPSSGRATVAVSDASRAFASGVSGGLAALRPKLLDREVKGVQKVVASGRGLADTSTAGLASAGRMAASEALSKADAAFTEKQASMGLRQGIISGLASAGGAYVRYRQPDTTLPPPTPDRAYVMTPDGSY